MLTSRITTHLVMFLATLFLTTYLSADVSDAQLAKGVAVAEEWLKIVDQQKYDQSWDATAQPLKEAMAKSDWSAFLTATRTPLGAVETRKIIEKAPASNPEGLPAGEYMFILYQTTFANHVPGQELVTLSLASDGVWHVMTYLVKANEPEEAEEKAEAAPKK